MSDSKDAKDPKITDAIKKIFTAGVSGALLSEDLLKTYLSDLKLPKDLLQIIIQGAQKSKEDLTGKVSRELIQVLNKVDWVEASSKFLENHKVSLKMDIEFTKKNSSPPASVTKDTAAASD